MRYAKGCDPSDLWVTYFSSSRHVHDFVKSHGNPVCTIRKIFPDAYSARMWESRVLHRLHVLSNPLWLNRTDNTSIDPELARAGASKPKSQHMRDKLRATLKAHPRTMSANAIAKLNAGWRSHPHGKQPNISKSLVGNSRRTGYKDSAATINRKRAAAQARCYIQPNLDALVSTKANVKLSTFRFHSKG